MIIHINGWPGVGKKTIGEIVADRLRARFIHNHVLHDVAFACAGKDDNDRWPLYEAVRSAAYQVLQNRPSSELFVTLIPIVLEASVGELSKRITSPERLSTKLKEASYLSEMVSRHSLQYPQVAETACINTEACTAEQSASRVLDHIEAVRSSCSVASAGHLQFQ